MNIQEFFEEKERKAQEKIGQGKAALEPQQRGNTVSNAEQGDSTVIPVVHETAQVHKEVVESATVRVHKNVTEVEKSLEVPLVRENYEIKRVPVDRIIEEHPSIREEGNCIIIPVVEEVLVVQKKLKLVEEVHLIKRQITETHKETITVKQEELKVERVPTGNSTGNKV